MLEVNWASIISESNAPCARLCGAMPPAAAAVATSMSIAPPALGRALDAHGAAQQAAAAGAGAGAQHDEPDTGPPLTPDAVKLLLERALAERSLSGLRTAWADARRRERSGATGAAGCSGAPSGARLPLPAGVLVRCAEVALALGVPAIATEALTSYRAAIARGVPSGDQFSARAHYASALVAHEAVAAERRTGQALVQGTLSALEEIVKGVQAASRSASGRHSFLAYNGSVHYWTVSRPLQREGVRPLLLPTLEAVCSALATAAADVPGLDAWRARYLTLLARCTADAGGGKADEAAKHVGEACELATKAAAAPEQQLGDDGGGTDGGALEAARALRAHLNPTKAASHAGADKQQAAVARLQAVRSKGAESLDDKGAEAELRAIWAAMDAAGARAVENPNEADPAPEPAEGIGMRVVAEVAWVAAARGLVDLAKAAAARAAQAATLAPRSKAEMALVAATLWRAPSDPAPRLTASLVQAHTDALRRLDGTLSSLLRLRDARVVTECCQLIWTAALPLLQPNLRSRAQRALASAARALEAVSSPQHELRARLHLELALCDVAEDMLSTAQVHCSKGLALDYVASDAEEAARVGLPRPWDAYLLPLAKRLKLRSDIYHQPEDAKDQALLLIERVRDRGGKGGSSGVALRASMLERAIALLEGAWPAPPSGGEVDAAESGAETVPKLAFATQLSVWAEVMKAAWSIGLPPLVHRAAPRIFGEEWAPPGGWDGASDREALRMQADACFIDAEASAALARREGGRLLAPAAVRRAARGGQPVSAEHARCAERLLLGMRKGLELKDPVVVQNAAVYAWNYFLPVLDAMEFADLLPLLEQLFDGLLEVARGVEGGDKELDGALVCCIAEATARALEHAHFAEEAEAAARAQAGEAEVEWADADALRCVEAPASYKELLAAAVEREAVPPQAAAGAPPRLARAEAVCKAALPLSMGRRKRELVATLARVVGWAGGDVAADAQISGGGAGGAEDSESRAVALIESLSRPPPAGESGEQAQQRTLDTISSAIKALGDSAAASADVELWARLAAGALKAKDHQRAIECAERAARLAPPAAAAAAAAQATPPGGASRALSDAEAPVAPERCVYWLSVAEGVCGRSLAALVNPAAQSRAAQDVLRNRALERLCRACAHGAAAGRKDLCMYAARQLWNTALPFAHATATRKVLTPYLERVTSHLASLAAAHGHVSDSDSDLALYIQFYALLFECLASEERWADGATYADEAFRLLPPSAHRALWEHRIGFLTRLGKDAVKALGHVGDYEESLQARIWLTLAESSPMRAVQLSAYHKAIDCLKDRLWLRVDYMVDYATWLYLNGLPPADAEDVLLSAADLVVDLEGDAEDDAVSDRLMKSARTARTGHSWARSKSRGGLMATPVSRAVSRGAGAHVSLPAEADTPRAVGSRAGARPGTGALAPGDHGSGIEPGPHPWQQSRFGANTPHSRGPSRAATRYDDDGRPMSRATTGYRSFGGSPTSRAGMSPISRAGTAASRALFAYRHRPERLNATHYRLLVRVMLSLAQITIDTKSRADFTLLSQHYCVAMLTRCLEEVADAMVSAEAEAGGEEAARRRRMAVPATLEAWARFKLPAAARAALLASASDAVINAGALERPQLLLANLDALWTTLRDMGLHLHAAPVAQAAIIVADAAMASAPATVVWRLRLAELQVDLDMADLALEVEADALLPDERTDGPAGTEMDASLPPHAVCASSPPVPLRVTPEERARIRDEVMARLAIKEMASDGRATPFDADRFGRPSPPPSQADLQTQMLEMRISGAPGTVVLQPPNEREALLARARFLLRRGALRDARECLAECLSSARAFDDAAAAAWCECHLGELELLKGDARAAVRHCEAALAGGGDTLFWRTAAVTYARARSAIGESAGAVEALRGAAAAAERMAEEKPFAEHAARRTAAELALECARMLVAQALGEATERPLAARARAEGLPPATADRRASSKLSAGVDMLSAAADAFASLGGGPPLVECQLELARTIDAGAPLQHGAKDYRALRETLLRRRAVLLAAATEAASVVAAAKPAREVGGLSLPAERLLARTEAALADVDMALSEAHERAEEADMDATRPDFPGATGGAEAEAHLGEVRRFLDSCVKASGKPPAVLSSVEAAVTHAANARALCRGEGERARCGARLGMALLRAAAEARAKLGAEAEADGEAGAWRMNDTDGGKEGGAEIPNDKDEAESPSKAPRAVLAADSPRPATAGSSGTRPDSRQLWSRGAHAAIAGSLFAESGRRVGARADSAQGVAMLERACHDALAARMHDVAGPTALRLAMCAGRRAPARAASWLAVAQGVASRADALAAYATAAAPMDREAMAARLYEHCAASMPRPADSALAARHAAQLAAEGSSWAALEVDADPLAALRDATLPAGVRVVVLHAPKGEATLYMAHLAQSTEEPAEAEGEGGADDSHAAFSAEVARAPLDEGALVALCQDFDRWQARVERAMTASMRRALVVQNAAYIAGNAADGAGGGSAAGSAAGSAVPSPQRGGVPASESVAGSAAGSTAPSPRRGAPAEEGETVSGEGGDAADGAEATDGERGAAEGATDIDGGDAQAPTAPSRPFVLADESLDAEWTALLERTVALFGAPLLRAWEAAAARGDAALGEGESKDKGAYVLVADSALSALPLERALHVLRGRAVSRDLSVHALARRARGGEAASFDASSGAYLLDPRGLDNASWAAAPGRAAPPATEALAAAGATLGSWRGFDGFQHAPSRGELQHALREAGAFVFYGPGAFMAHIAPDAVAALDLSSLGMAVLLDRSSNDDHTREQAYLDNRKQGEVLALERPHAAASLMLARGARCVVLPRAAWAVDAQFGALQTLMPKLLAQGGPGAAKVVAAFEEEVAARAPASFLEAHMLVYGLPHAAAN